MFFVYTCIRQGLFWKTGGSHQLPQKRSQISCHVDSCGLPTAAPAQMRRALWEDQRKPTLEDHFFVGRFFVVNEHFAGTVELKETQNRPLCSRFCQIWVK